MSSGCLGAPRVGWSFCCLGVLKGPSFAKAVPCGLIHGAGKETQGLCSALPGAPAGASPQVLLVFSGPAAARGAPVWLNRAVGV